ncbi:Ig-like domain-containing protein [Flavobacterium notoginsengisoli]|uniref:Ig-like domain-containing protein n=1 Tax=Flavobacterium notoginsengisoli TaxID=1478199 RepID=UPI00363424CB
MKNNKLLVVIVLLGFLSFGMKYNNIINKNVVAPIVESLAKAEKPFIATKDNNKSKKAEVKEKANLSSAVAATVTVNNVVAVNGGGNAQPGSQLDYTITITNSGADDALGMTFQDILDSNLTLVANSFKATPVANNNSYSCIGNVGITVDAAGGVLANDVSPDATALTATILTAPTNGTVNLAPNGSFTYNSTAGYSGSDSFTYTLTSTNGKTSTATVNITVSTPIIFVNSAASTAGNGTLTTPYKALNSITGTSTNPIFIYSGIVTGLLTLNDNQKVIGQGATSGLASILNITVPTYSNTLPSTGGANPTIAGINLKSNNDIQAVTMTGTLSGSNVGTLKIKNTSINATNLQAVNITGTGTIDCVFSSISANGNPVKGISVNSPGSFQITGSGTTTGSGGTIQNIQQRGAEFISCTNVTLKNMNFTNSSTSGVNVNVPNPQNNNTNSFAALHFKTISGGVTLDNIAVSGTTNSIGINLNDVNNFVLSNSAITGCGSANGGNVNVGGIFALDLKGTCSITNTTVNDSWGRGFFGYNGISQNPTLSLTVTDSQFKNSFNKSNGDSNFIFQAKGTSINTLVFKKNDFSNPKTTGLALNFNGSSVNTVQIGGNTAATDANTINAASSNPGSNGLSLQVNGTATVNYNIINNTIKSSFSSLSALSVGNQGLGTIKGRINNNTIDGGSSPIGNGITVSAYGNAKHITEIANNTITNAANYGIFSEANDNGTIGSGRIDASITNNNISVINNAYTHIGIVSYADNSSSTMKSAAKVTGNIVNAATGLAAGNFDVLSQGPNCEVILQGTSPYASGSDKNLALTNFWKANNNNNGTAIDEAGSGKVISGTVTLPDNGTASKMAPQNDVQEETKPAAESTVNNSAINDNSVTAKSAAVNATATTLSAGPFTLAAGKSTVITFSATINAASTLPQNTCAVTNQATVNGSNFSTVNSNITTTSIKPGSAIATADTQNIPCLGSTAVTLNATCPLGTTATWYTAMSGGTSFATGASVSATPTANNTTYCVACETAYCASDRVLVKTVTGTPSTTSPAVTMSACDSYTWSANGTTYTSSGTYTTVVGCDTKTLNLTITPSTTSTPETISACDSYTWSANGTTYTSSGTYTTVVGCDTKKLILTITPSTSSPAESQTACDSYTWPINGVTYTTTGNYTHKIGCDTKTLALTITNSTSSTQTESACDTYTWPVNGVTYSTSGNYTHKVGCDTKTLALTITKSTSSSETQTACDSYTWLVNGLTYTASGNYTHKVGCETKTLALTIIKSTSSTQTESACDSYNWSVNGMTYTSSGVYDYTVGCDTKTLALTITKSTNSSESQTACDNYTWPTNGITYTTSGNYTHKVGCDTKTLALTITKSTNSSESQTACDSYTWPVNGITYTTSGNYTHKVGCDTKTLVLTITKSTNSSESQNACDSYTWPANGITYTTSGNYTHKVGCDTKTLALTITKSTNSSESQTACDSYTWPVNGVTYTTSGNYTHKVGCDTKTLALTITKSTNSSESQTACDSYTWPVNGVTYTTSGNYIHNVGCDTKTLALTVTKSTSSTQTESACNSYTWSVNGNTYTTSGTYTHTVGCDTKILALTITNTTSNTVVEHACDSYTWPVNGITYTSSGTYNYSVGCDTKTLSLIITNSTNSTETVTACEVYVWPINGTTFSTSGVYSHTVGCDTKTLVLTITNPSDIVKTVSLNSGILTADHSGARYQWYKCPNTLLTNETNQSFTPSVVGDYKVAITIGECTTVSDCMNVTNLGLDDFKVSQFKMYPVPSRGILNIVTKYNGKYIIVDAAGKLVKSVHLNADILNTIHLEDLADGVYLIQNTDHNTFKAQKFILKK